MSGDDLWSELVDFVRANAPATLYTAGYALEPKRWILSKDTADALRGSPYYLTSPGADPNSGWLMALPFRVDEAATEPYALEPLPVTGD